MAYITARYLEGMEVNVAQVSKTIHSQIKIKCVKKQ